MSTPPLPVIALVGLHHLSAEAVEMGVDVLTDANERTAIMQARRAVADHPDAVLLVDADLAINGIVAWAKKVAASHRVVAFAADADDFRFGDDLPAVGRESTLAEALTAVGLHLEHPLSNQSDDSDEYDNIFDEPIPSRDDTVVAAHGASESGTQTQHPTEAESHADDDFWDADTSNDADTSTPAGGDLWDDEPAPAPPVVAGDLKPDEQPPADEDQLVNEPLVDPNWTPEWDQAPPAPIAAPVPEPIEPAPAPVQQSTPPLPAPPPTTPTRPVPPAPSPAPTPAHIAPIPGLDDLFATTEREVPAEVRSHVPRGTGAVVVSWAPGGGVGKSSAALAIAQIAGSVGKRVILIDGNRGQGNLRTYLRLDGAPLPSVYDFVRTGRLDDALSTPTELNAARGNGGELLTFGFVPTASISALDTGDITPQAYLRLVREAQAHADLVVLDTQIVEAKDFTGMVDQLLVPLFASGAYGLSITDDSPPKLRDLLFRLDLLISKGAERSRMLSMVNLVDEANPLNLTNVRALYGDRSVFIGAIARSSAVKTLSTRGVTPAAHSGFRRVLAAALSVIFPDQEFRAMAAEPADNSGRRKSFWRRKP